MLFYTVKWKELIWPKNGAKTSESSLVLAWGQFGPIEMGLFLAPIFGVNQPNCKGQIGPCERPIWKILDSHWNLKGQNGPQNFSPPTNDPLKRSQFSSNLGHFRSRELFPLHTDFSPTYFIFQTLIYLVLDIVYVKTFHIAWFYSY